MLLLDLFDALLAPCRGDHAVARIQDIFNELARPHLDELLRQNGWRELCVLATCDPSCCTWSSFRASTLVIGSLSSLSSSSSGWKNISPMMISTMGCDTGMTNPVSDAFMYRRIESCTCFFASKYFIFSAGLSRRILGELHRVLLDGVLVEVLLTEWW